MNSINLRIGDGLKRAIEAKKKTKTDPIIIPVPITLELVEKIIKQIEKQYRCEPIDGDPFGHLNGKEALDELLQRLKKATK